MGQSELSRIRTQISDQYVAAKLGLSGLATGYSRHEYITARQERIGVLHNQLETILGAEQAMRLLTETTENLPEKGNREHVIHVVLDELGDSLETQHLIDWIRGMWETIDLLKERFGEETAQKIVQTLS